jgi:hypothetical protein
MNPMHTEWLAIDHGSDLHRDAADSRLLAAARWPTDERSRPKVELGRLRALVDAARGRLWPSPAHSVGSPQAASSPPPGVV